MQTPTFVPNLFLKMCTEVKMYNSSATDTYKGEPFPFPSKLLVGLQTINNTNKFSKVISCLKF